MQVELFYTQDVLPQNMDFRVKDPPVRYLD